MIVSGDSVSEDSVKYHTVRSVSEMKIKFKELKEGVEIEKSEKVQKVAKNHENHTIYDGCESSKVCFGIPAGCVDDGDCKSVVSVQKSGKFQLKVL